MSVARLLEVTRDPGHNGAQSLDHPMEATGTRVLQVVMLKVRLVGVLGAMRGTGVRTALQLPHLLLQ